MSLPIENITDLKGEIYRLKGLEEQQSVALGQRFKSPATIFSTINSLFPKTANANGTKNAGTNQDILGLISRFVLPFTLNKTIFKRSNFLIKTLVGMVSQKASHFISEDAATSVWDKIKSVLLYTFHIF